MSDLVVSAFHEALLLGCHGAQYINKQQNRLKSYGSATESPNHLPAQRHSFLQGIFRLFSQNFFIIHGVKSVAGADGAYIAGGKDPSSRIKFT